VKNELAEIEIIHTEIAGCGFDGPECRATAEVVLHH
jgi:hypothetical protein